MSRRTCRHDKAYKAWIHELECLICEHTGRCQRTPTEAHHAGDDKGMRQKPPDSTCLPLCEAHHRVGHEAWHDKWCCGRAGFERMHGVDVDAEIARLNREYEATGAALAKAKPKKQVPAKPVAGAKQSMSERLRELRESQASRKR